MNTRPRTRLSRSDRPARIERATTYRNRFVRLASLADRDQPHMTRVTASGQEWVARCACRTWVSKPTAREATAKGAATRHRNRAAAA